MLILLRSLLLRVWLVLVTAVIGTLAFVTLARRDWALALGKFWSRTVLFGARVFCGIDHRIEAPQHMPASGALVAAKHQSFWETMALTVILPKPCFILKKELLMIPMFGWWLRACGFIPIDRKSGINAMRSIIERAEKEAAAGYQVLIFPEGTRMQPGTTGTYHPGVAGIYSKLGLPCYPIAHNSGLYWKQPGLIRHPGTITVSFLPSVPPGLSRKGFMAELQEVIETKSLDLAGIAREEEPEDVLPEIAAAEKKKAKSPISPGAN